MARRVLLLLVLAGLVLSCAATPSQSSSVTSQSVSCVDPPPEEVARVSTLMVSVVPNPVIAGSQAILSVAPAAFSGDGMVGAGAQWQCWNGTDWVDTYQIVRGFGGYGAVTLQVQPGATTTVPAIGLPIPNSYPIIIPDVEPGMYGILDTVEPAKVSGFVMVQVVDTTSGRLQSTPLTTLEVGVPHGYLFPLHCGMRYISDVDGRNWETPDPPYDGVGPVPETLRDFYTNPNESISPVVVGIVELAEPDVLEFKVGKTAVRYTPTTAEIPGCA
jgi:hypothetical protein